MLEFGHEEGQVDSPTEVPKPQVKTLESTENYGKFGVEPLQQGYAITLGNPLRRALLSSIPGTAITWVKIDGVLHEYSTIPHVKEDVTEILLNIKGIRLRSFTNRPGKLRLEVSEEGKVSAGDVVTSSDFTIVNPELHLATLDSSEARLSIELNVDHGTGYVPATQSNGLPIGVLPVDAIFTPVTKVNYAVERTRVGQATDYERLVLEVWTDGTITPLEAVRKAANTLLEHFFLFSGLGAAGEGEGERSSAALTIPPEQYNMPVEKLDLSARTLNCLKRAHIGKVGQALEMSAADLMKIRNFGEKSMNELYTKLRELGLMPLETPEEEGETPQTDEEGIAEEGETPPQTDEEGPEAEPQMEAQKVEEE